MRRLPLLALALLALLFGLWSGLLRLGWAWSGMGSHLPAIHGPLMVGGFLGTLVSLERAVAVERRWAFAAPALTGSGAVALLIGAPVWLGALLITLGSLVTIAIFGVIIRMQPALFTYTIALGAVLWTVGNALWLWGWSVPRVVLWWVGFLVLTIAGERLELSRLLRLTRTVRGLFVAAAALLLIGLCISLVHGALGARIAGAGLLALAGWLLRFDIARRRLKAGGLARFIALALLTGYVWLGIGGMLAIRYGQLLAGPFYDALLHTLFLGFVFSMIFGHAPIIFPAVLGVPMPYSPRLYTHLVLLHITLLVRVLGDLLPWWPGRLWGGLLNALVLLLFLVNTVLSLGQQSVRPAGAPVSPLRYRQEG